MKLKLMTIFVQNLMLVTVLVTAHMSEASAEDFHSQVSSEARDLPQELLDSLTTVHQLYPDYMEIWKLARASSTCIRTLDVETHWTKAFTWEFKVVCTLLTRDSGSPETREHSILIEDDPTWDELHKGGGALDLTSSIDSILSQSGMFSNHEFLHTIYDKVTYSRPKEDAHLATSH